MQKLAALSVDLDEIPHYFAIHGLPPPGKPQAQAVYDTALPRILDFADTLKLPLTLFVVGADLARQEATSALSHFVDQRHELGNHTQDHRYDLTRLSAVARRRQIADAARAIEQATGVQPKGFRAPGYTLSDGIFDDLSELGYAYDSSLLACPAYYALKIAAIAAGRALGRRSASIIDKPRTMLAPTQPYRTGKPYYQPGRGLLEIPISVTPGLRLPYIGTALSVAGNTPLGTMPALALTSMMYGHDIINLEFHGLDFLDAADGLACLSRYQPDLMIPWRQKVLTYSTVVLKLKKRGYHMTTLLGVQEHLAESLAQEGDA